MRIMSLKAGLAAAVIAVSSVGAFAAPASLTPLQINALENHDAMPSQAFTQGKVAFTKQVSQNSGRYDKLEREAWQNNQ